MRERERESKLLTLELCLSSSKWLRATTQIQTAHRHDDLKHNVTPHRRLPSYKNLPTIHIYHPHSFLPSLACSFSRFHSIMQKYFMCLSFVKMLLVIEAVFVLLLSLSLSFCLLHTVVVCVWSLRENWYHVLFCVSSRSIFYKYEEEELVWVVVWGVCTKAEIRTERVKENHGNEREREN